MDEWDKPRFGEAAVSWQTVWDCLYPDYTDAPHDDAAASEMHRLRGLVMAQCAETETVLGKIATHLDGSLSVERRTAGQLLQIIRRLLGEAGEEWTADLRLIDDAVKRRNHAVHSPVTIGSDWMPYATGGGEWVPVISFMGEGCYDEADLRRDLALQHEATVAAVRIFYVLSVGVEEADRDMEFEKTAE